jgi:hypothetical protein
MVNIKRRKYQITLLYNKAIQKQFITTLLKPFKNLAPTLPSNKNFKIYKEIAVNAHCQIINIEKNSWHKNLFHILIIIKVIFQHGLDSRVAIIKRIMNYKKLVLTN